MTKTRLNDTEALASQGINEAGLVQAENKDGDSPWTPDCEPAFGSADYAVGTEARKREQQRKLMSPQPWPGPERPRFREAGVGGESLSGALSELKK